MLKFAANISLMFQEVPLERRFEAAKRAGFDGVEFMFPENLTSSKVRSLLDNNGLDQVLANLPLLPGSKGNAAVPGRESLFKEQVQREVEFALATDAPLMHLTAGVVRSREYEGACCTFRCAKEGLDVLSACKKYSEDAAHIQIAGHPGRHEPNNGDLPYRPLIKAIGNSGYRGWVGCEYIPAKSTLSGLGWMSGLTI